MKKASIMCSLLMMSLFLTSCDGGSSNVTSQQPDVASVQWVTEDTLLAPGNYELEAVTLPATADQEVRFAILGNPVDGVGLSGTTLSVSVNALDGATFTVVATSVYDPTKKANKQFEIDNEVSNVIEISTAAELIALSNDSEGWDQAYALTNDIVLTEPFTPISEPDYENDLGETIKGNPFNGHFDGRGFKISGIDINNNAGALFNAGFFAQVGPQGIVENLELEGTVLANGWSGGVAGINEGTIRNVISNVNVTVSGTSAGGLVSVNRGILEYSYAIGHVVSQTNANNVGRSAGLVAANEATLTEIYGDTTTMGTPNYIAFMPTVNPSYMLPTAEMKLAATWEAFDEEVWYVADGTYPLLKHEGFVPPVITPDPVILITNTVLELDLTVIDTLEITTEVYHYEGSDFVFSLVEPVIGVSLDGRIVSFDREIIAHDFSFTVEARIGTSEVYATKTFHAVYQPVIVDTTVHISTASELVNALSGQIVPENLSKTFVLDADITLEGEWSPIGVAANPDEGITAIPFTGTFDGQGHTISGISITSGWHKGFFAQIGATGIVKNTHFVGTIAGSGWLGGVAVINEGTIQDCLIELNIYAGSAVGAIVRENLGLIRNVVQHAWARTDLTPGAARSGALFVFQNGTLENVFASQTALESTLVSSWGDTTSDPTIILSDELFNSPATYSAFDTAIWDIPASGYPTLKASDGVVDTAIHISTATELVNALSGQTNPENLSKTFVLDANITLEGEWSPIGVAANPDEGIVAIPFTGTFDGRGHTITGISITSGWHKGFFAQIGATGIVKNTHFVGTIAGSGWLGGVAVINEGTIQDCLIELNIYAGSAVGAIVRENLGLIRNVVQHAWARTDLDPGTARSGALFVFQNGTLENVFSSQTALESTLVSSWGDTTSNPSIILSDELFNSAATYSAFDTAIWNIPASGYPTLIPQN